MENFWPLRSAVAALLLVTGCGLGDRDAGDGLAGSIRIDGSSTVYLITEAVAEEFRADSPRVRVTVGISGSGGGFKRFTRGETDISNASRPVKTSELELAEQFGTEFIELPVAYDGIAVVVHPDNDWCDFMTVAELKRLWEPEAHGRILRWSQIRPGWPDRPIHLFGPGVDSGTYDYFTEAIMGMEGASRADFTPSEDDNILVQGVSSNELALGFFGYAYYEENSDRLKLVAIDDENPENGDGPIFPTPETVRTGTYQPLSRPVFIYINRESADRPEVERFVEFYLENAAELSREVGYVPLPEGVYRLVMERFRKRVTDTLFAEPGSQVGVSLEDFLEMKAAEPAP